MSDGAADSPKPVFDFEMLTTEFGWLMIGVGVIGVILPGLPGAPFFIAGAAVLIPGGKKRLTRWVAEHPGPMVQDSVNILARFVDDLETRYPRPK